MKRSRSNFWAYLLLGIFATLAAAGLVFYIIAMVKYWNVPASEIPWWVWWIGR